MRHLWHSVAAAGLLSANLVLGEPYTPKHEAGRCSIRGNCGKPNLFSPELPCPDNGLAKDPEDDVRKQLVEICGPKWNAGPVCCEAEQVRHLPFADTRQLLTFSSLMPFQVILRRPTTSSQPAPHAKRTSTTYSAPSPAPPTNRYLSM